MTLVDGWDAVVDVGVTAYVSSLSPFATSVTGNAELYFFTAHLEKKPHSRPAIYLE